MLRANTALNPPMRPCVGVNSTIGEFPAPFLAMSARNEYGRSYMSTSFSVFGGKSRRTTMLSEYITAVIAKRALKAKMKF